MTKIVNLKLDSYFPFYFYGMYVIFFPLSPSLPLSLSPSLPLSLSSGGMPCCLRPPKPEVENSVVEGSGKEWMYILVTLTDGVLGMGMGQGSMGMGQGSIT